MPFMLLKMHWRAAYDFCRSKGKSLLSIESLMKANEIKSYLPLLIGKGIYDLNIFYIYICVCMYFIR